MWNQSTNQQEDGVCFFPTFWIKKSEPYTNTHTHHFTERERKKNRLRQNHKKRTITMRTQFWFEENPLKTLFFSRCVLVTYIICFVITRAFFPFCSISSRFFFVVNNKNVSHFCDHAPCGYALTHKIFATRARVCVCRIVAWLVFELHKNV